MNFSSIGTSLDLNTFPVFCSSSDLPLLANVDIKSQPGIFSLSVCFCILGALRHKPSPMTNSTPPRILGSSMFLTRPYPAHSMSSVDSPLTIIGQALTIVSISFGEGLYCSPFLYNPNSSFTRSTSSSVGL